MAAELAATPQRIQIENVMEIQKSVKVGYAIASLLLLISVIGLFTAKKLEIEAVDRPKVEPVNSDKAVPVEPRPFPIYRVN